jgi:hypothetical protein
MEHYTNEARILHDREMGHASSMGPILIFRNSIIHSLDRTGKPINKRESWVPKIKGYYGEILLCAKRVMLVFTPLSHIIYIYIYIYYEMSLSKYPPSFCAMRLYHPHCLILRIRTPLGTRDILVGLSNQIISGSCRSQCHLETIGAVKLIFPLTITARHFLRSCSLCKRRLVPCHGIYMYK